MFVYLGATGSKTLISELEDLGFGQATQPYEKPPTNGRRWFLDNGAFADWRNNRTFRCDKFFAAFGRAVMLSTRPDFVVVPDRVADRTGTLAMARRWVPRLAGPIRLYVVAQDGMTPTDLESMVANDNFGGSLCVPGVRGVFVGGSVEWKVRNGEWIAKWAHARYLKCHVGQVGTGPRVAWAKTIGADSIDSALPLWAKANMDRFMRSVNQEVLWGNP